MTKPKQNNVNSNANLKRKPPAQTPEAQEQRMINLAMEQAEQMLMEKRAPAPVVVHFLKLATEKYKNETEKIRAEASLSASKSEILMSQKHTEELYEKAIQAFKGYSGDFSSPDEDDEYVRH